MEKPAAMKEVPVAAFKSRGRATPKGTATAQAPLALEAAGAV
jgi:hypothetical protein